MTFEELLKDEIFQLPLVQPENGDFKTFITKKLNQLLEKINELNEGVIHEKKSNIQVHFVKDVQKQNIHNLIECIKEYYNGHPFKAYENLNRIFNNSYKNLSEIFKYKVCNPDESFFRIRLRDGNFLFQKKEMFYIPFEMLNKVSTQRYSIPGFPSLYLGRTVYICWEELNRPSIDKFQAIRYKNISL